MAGHVIAPKAGFTATDGEGFAVQGKCREVSAEWFFSPTGERGAARDRREAAAKKICGRCPVRLLCAEWALATREPYGTWGGLTEDERREILHKRAQARRTAGEAAQAALGVAA